MYEIARNVLNRTIATASLSAASLAGGKVTLIIVLVAVSSFSLISTLF